MILYFDQHQINHLKIKNFFIDRNILNTLHNLNLLSGVYGSKGSFYTRKGINTLPLKNEITHISGFDMPDYDPYFAKSWTEITDTQCVHLRSKKFDRPWVVQWSGGIDSTGIVSAIIKNLPKSDFENITIACDSMSVWENPQFYYKFILPNFKTVDSHWTVKNNFIETNNYLINGELGDQLFAPAQDTCDKIQSVLYQTPFNYNLFFEFILTKTADTEFTKWFCDFFTMNISSTAVPITNLHDATWWMHFNFNWAGVKLRMLRYGDWARLKNAKIYFDKLISWFDCYDYQQWAMNSNVVNKKFGSNFSDLKLAAKMYIYELDKNNYYKTYKTKIMSGEVASNTPLDNWCCMLNNYDLLNVREHEDQILKLLPTHLIK